MRFHTLKYRVMDETGGNGNDAGGGGQANQKPNENNSQSNLSPYRDLWQSNDNQGDKGNQPQQGNNQQNQSNQQVTDPQKAMSDHIAGLGLTAGVDTAAIMQGLQQGDPTALQGAFESVAAKAYQSAITTMNSVVEQRVKKAMDEVSNTTSNKVNSNLAIRELNEKLPFTSEPEIAPIAKAVFTQLMNKGKSVQEAITETGKYFGHVSKMASKFVDTTPPQSRPGSTNFNRQQQQNADNEPDWMSILGGDNE